MICLKCDCEDFAADEAEVRQEFKGETLTVLTPMMVCAKCGWRTVGNDQIDELRLRTADTYRSKHDLLTSRQIKEMRKALGMNQHEFAKFLCVGEASVKRWETWHVQDASSNRLMRLTAENEMLRRQIAGYKTAKSKAEHVTPDAVGVRLRKVRIFYKSPFGITPPLGTNLENLGYYGSIQMVGKDFPGFAKGQHNELASSETRRFTKRPVPKTSVNEATCSTSCPATSGLSPPVCPIESLSLSFPTASPVEDEESVEKEMVIETK